MPQAPAHLESERLLLRPFREDDLDAYARICSEEEVLRYVSGRPLTRAECWRQIALFLGHWQLRGFGLWAAEEKASGRLLGRIGLWQPEGWPGLEVAWLLDRAVWGRGFASEGGRAALACAFGTLGADAVYSVIHPNNQASIRVAEKIGERLLRRDKVDGTAVVIYAIDRRTYEQQFIGQAPPTALS